MSKLIAKLQANMINWLTKERSVHEYKLCDFNRLRYEIKPCDILLTEGSSRVSEIIKSLTKSPWSHACIYIGRIHDIDNPSLREYVSKHYQGAPEDQLIVESLLGQGTIVTSLQKYQQEHIRICRPIGISAEDAQQVIAFAISGIGLEYNVRHIFDLMRLLLPWSILPRRWFSSLFDFKSIRTREICSSLLAEAFALVQFPILPYIKEIEGKPQLIPRNPRLFTPRDFDYSPYFNIIKYPMYGIHDSAVYRNLPWADKGIVSNDHGNIYIPTQSQSKIQAKLHRIMDSFKKKKPKD